MHYDEIISLVEKNLKNVNNFAMLMYLYWLKSAKTLLAFGVRTWRIVY